MKFREHKGGLSESMNTVVEVSNIDEIKNHLNPFYKDFGLEIEELKFKYVGYDKRVDWDTYYVLQRLKGSKTFTVAGMSDGCF